MPGFLVRSAARFRTGPELASVEDRTIAGPGGALPIGIYTPDGDAPLTYLWTAPAGVTLSSATAAVPTFTAPDVTATTPFMFTLALASWVAIIPLNALWWRLLGVLP